MKIGVIGGGVVGHATARTYMEYGEVKVYDEQWEKATATLTDTLDSDIIFLCVPETGLDTLCNTLWSEKPNGNYVLKSTVEIGRTRELSKTYSLPNMVHSPEFLTARCAIADAQVPARNIVGVTHSGEALAVWKAKPFIARNSYEWARHPIFNLSQRRFPHIPLLLMTSEESEATKLIQNAFFAVKVSFFNEVQQLCVKHGLDWATVLNALLADGRISPSHTKVPGPDGKYGFGGACLPKDLNMLRRLLNEAGVRSDICTAAVERNEVDRSANR